MNAILVSEIDELLKNGNRAKAVRARGMAEAAIELHREDPIFHLKAAEACLVLHDFDNAEKYARGALELKPDIPIAHFLLGQTSLFLIGETRSRKEKYELYEKALEEYRMEREIDPEFEVPHWHSAALLFKGHLVEEANSESLNAFSGRGHKIRSLTILLLTDASLFLSGLFYFLASLILWGFFDNPLSFVFAFPFAVLAYVVPLVMRQPYRRRALFVGTLIVLEIVFIVIVSVWFRESSFLMQESSFKLTRIERDAARSGAVRIDESYATPEEAALTWVKGVVGREPEIVWRSFSERLKAEAWNDDYSVFVKDYFERLDIPDEERIIDVVAEDRGENGEYGRRSVSYRIQYLHDDTGQVLSTGGDLQFSKSGGDWKIDQMKYLLF